MKQLQEYTRVQAKELFSESIEAGKEVALKFKGISMAPLIELGDEVFFKKSRNIAFGDLVVYRKKGAFIVHRFIRKTKISNKIFYILKGDNLKGFDKPIEDREVIGVVTKLKRKNKTLALYTLTGKAMSLLYFIVSSSRLILMPKASVESRKAFADEREILKLIAKDRLLEKEELELIKIFKNNLNWGYLSGRIKRHFLTPFFFKKIKHINLATDLPQDSLAKLDNIYMLQIARDTKNRDTLETVLTTFNNKDIDTLVLKGPHLGLEVYDDTSERQMGDIDLLVKGKDWFRACEVLISLGFILQSDLKNYNMWGIKYLDSHIDLYKDGTKLELKSNYWPIEFPYFDYSLWEKARPAAINKHIAYFASHEDTLLIACVNLVRHNFQGLIWFLDIKKIIDKFADSIDWQLFINTAKKQDLDNAVYYALDLTDKLLCLRLPWDLLAGLKPNVLDDRLFNFFWNKKAILLEEEGSPFKAKIPFEIALVLFTGKFSLKPKKLLAYTAYMLKIIFPPLNFIRNKYKIKAHPLLLLRYYIFRLFHFLFTLFNLIFKLLFKKAKYY